MSVLAFNDVAVPQADHSTRFRDATAVGVAAIALLNLLDLITTHLVLAHGGVEANPLAAPLLAGGRVAILKLGLVVGLGWRVLRRSPSVGFAAAVWFVAGFYFLTVVSNTLTFSRVL